jgi:SCP1.201-like deaminase
MGDKPNNPYKGLRTRAAAHPNSPAGGSGPGVARPQGVLGRVPGGPAIPSPDSPAGRLFPWRIKLPNAVGDGSFQFSATREGGLTLKESALLEQAHSYFGLEMGGKGKIAGVLILPNGTAYALVSGKHGGPHGGTQDGFIPRGKGSGLTRFNVTHIEGHSAAVLNRVAIEVMKTEKVAEASLLIPKEPCGACDPNIPQTLPSGTRLFVVDPESTTVYRSSSGASLEGLKFSRPEKLQFKVPKGMLRFRAVGRYAGQTLAMVGLSLLAGWLRAKVDKSMIDSQLKNLEPEIHKALQDKADEVLELIGKKQKAYANVTVDIWSITTIEPEPAPMPFTTCPVVSLTSVNVSGQDINSTGPERHERRLMQTINTTPATFSFEVGL